MLKKWQLVGIAKKIMKIAFYNVFIWAYNENLNYATYIHTENFIGTRSTTVTMNYKLLKILKIIDVWDLQPATVINLKSRSDYQYYGQYPMILNIVLTIIFIV